jgi:hypothetical protein
MGVAATVFFRFARHSPGIAPIDHTSAFDGKTAGHSGATDV